MQMDPQMGSNAMYSPDTTGECSLERDSLTFPESTDQEDRSEKLVLS